MESTIDFIKGIDSIVRGPLMFLGTGVCRTARLLADTVRRIDAAFRML